MSRRSIHRPQDPHWPSHRGCYTRTANKLTHTTLRIATDVFGKGMRKPRLAREPTYRPRARRLRFKDGPLLRGHGSSYRGLRYVWPRTVRDPDPPVWSGGPGNSYSEDPSQRRLRFKLDGLVTAEAQPHIRRLSNRWLSITGMIIHGHLTCRDSFGDIFTLTSGVEPTATSNSYIQRTNLLAT